MSTLTSTAPTLPPTATAADATGHRSLPARARSAVGALARRWRDDEGAATAEYAIVIMAAVGFAGLLVVIMRSDEVRGVLSDLVRSALTVG